jgi:hypothetical protein
MIDWIVVACGALVFFSVVAMLLLMMLVYDL